MAFFFMMKTRETKLNAFILQSFISYVMQIVLYKCQKNFYEISPTVCKNLLAREKIHTYYFLTFYSGFLSTNQYLNNRSKFRKL